jgi:hypothetical protein
MTRAGVLDPNTLCAFARRRCCSGTDVGAYPGVPVRPGDPARGPDSPHPQALYLTLAGMVRDRMVDLEWTVRMGEGVLRGNAEHLFGWGRAVREAPFSGVVTGESR